MCIIIYQPAGKEVPEDHFRESWRINSDGGGMMFAKDGEIYFYKQMKSVDRFYKVYKKAVTENPKANIVLHFRIASHGTVNKANCHPFLVHEKLAFCHNGIIDVLMPKGAKHSDTREFMFSILQKLPKDFINRRVYRRLISKFIGYSKLAFLDNRGKVTLIRSHLGVWEDEIWYSNTSFRPVSQAWNDSYGIGGYQSLAGYYHADNNRSGARNYVYPKKRSYSSKGNLMSNPAGSNKKSKAEKKWERKAKKDAKAEAKTDSIKNRQALYEEGFGKKDVKKIPSWIGQEGYDWADDCDTQDRLPPSCCVCTKRIEYPFELDQELCLQCQEDLEMLVVTEETADEKTIQCCDGHTYTVEKNAKK